MPPSASLSRRYLLIALALGVVWGFGSGCASTAPSLTPLRFESAAERTLPAPVTRLLVVAEVDSVSAEPLSPLGRSFRVLLRPHELESDAVTVSMGDPTGEEAVEARMAEFRPDGVLRVRMEKAEQTVKAMGPDQPMMNGMMMPGSSRSELLTTYTYSFSLWEPGAEAAAWRGTMTNGWVEARGPEAMNTVVWRVVDRLMRDGLLARGPAGGS